MRRVDRTGIRYGILTALEINKDICAPQKLQWKCKCDCGNVISVQANNLTTGNTESCGCTKFNGYQEISQGAWYRITSKAQKREIEFKITIQDAWDLYIQQNRKCALSNVDICFVRNIDHYWEQNASLDRIDSTKGYIIENLQWIHKDLNQVKNILSQEEFVFWCRAINQEQVDLKSNFIWQPYSFKKGKYSLYEEISLRYWQCNVIQAAKARDIEFNITVEQAWEKFIEQDRKCAITGVPLRFVADYRYNCKYQTASLDRIKNDKPYTVDNIQWVHRKINRIKHKHSLEYIQNWAKLVSNHYDQSNSGT